MVKYASAILFFTPLLLDATAKRKRRGRTKTKRKGGDGEGRRWGGIGGYSGARTSPPFLRNIVIAGRLAAFPRLGVTIIIEAEQDDREMRQLSHYGFDGRYHGETVRWSPACLSVNSWMVRLNISEFSSVFSRRYMVMLLFERSRQTLLAYLKRDIVNNREHLSMRKCDNFTRDHFIWRYEFLCRVTFCWFIFKARRSIAN